MVTGFSQRWWLCRDFLLRGLFAVSITFESLGTGPSGSAWSAPYYSRRWLVLALDGPSAPCASQLRGGNDSTCMFRLVLPSRYNCAMQSHALHTLPSRLFIRPL